jgi:23S rRNA-/tRNA-specific pseudouridylate synthase
MRYQPPYTIVYEDDSLVAINKASGFSVSGDRWNESKERIDRMIDAYVGARVYTVHRLDKDASGLAVFAKDAAVHKRFCAAFESSAASKVYMAAVLGRPSWQEASCDLPLLVDGDKQHRTIIDRYNGK